MAERKKSSKKSGSGLGCILWVAFLLLLTGLFLFNREAIAKTLKGINLTGKVTQDRPAPANPAAPATQGPQSQEKTAPVDAKSSGETTSPQASPATTVSKPSGPEQKTTDSSGKQAAQPVEKQSEKPDAKPVKQESKTVAVKPSAPTVKPAIPPAKPSAKPVKTDSTADKSTAKTAERALWFMSVAPDGSISRAKTSRRIAVSDSPLLDALTALISGPTADERKHGMSSLIPSGTKLISATVRGSTAYLNLNEAFQFNSFGAEGYAAQLKEIVWTATEFSNVQDVQILIEGQRLDYLGSEGIWIGSPVNRNSFQQTSS